MIHFLRVYWGFQFDYYYHYCYYYYNYYYNNYYYYYHFFGEQVNRTFVSRDLSLLPNVLFPFTVLEAQDRTPLWPW